MKIHFRQTIAAGIAVAFCVFAADDRSPASPASTGGHAQAAITVAWIAAPQPAPAHASWEGLMNVGWR